MKTWTQDFTPPNVHHTLAQDWVHIHDLSQEYWWPKIIFSTAGSLGIPDCIVSISNKHFFDRAFGQYVKNLVDIYLTKELRHKILVERI